MAFVPNLDHIAMEAITDIKIVLYSSVLRSYKELEVKCFLFFELLN